MFSGRGMMGQNDEEEYEDQEEYEVEVEEEGEEGEEEAEEAEEEGEEEVEEAEEEAEEEGEEEELSIEQARDYRSKTPSFVRYMGEPEKADVFFIYCTPEDDPDVIIHDVENPNRFVDYYKPSFADGDKAYIATVEQKWVEQGLKDEEIIHAYVVDETDVDTIDKNRLLRVAREWDEYPARWVNLEKKEKLWKVSKSIGFQFKLFDEVPENFPPGEEEEPIFIENEVRLVSTLVSLQDQDYDRRLDCKVYFSKFPYGVDAILREVRDKGDLNKGTYRRIHYKNSECNQRDKIVRYDVTYRDQADFVFHITDDPNVRVGWLNPSKAKEWKKL